MFKLSFVFCVFLIFYSCIEKEKPSYTEIIQSKRDFIELSFKGPNSPLKKKDKELFTGLSYYDVDSNFRVTAKLKWNLEVKPVFLIRDTSITSMYYPSANLTFSINSKHFELTGYTSSLKNKTEIFIPFYDLTSGKETYGGGRFLEVTANADEVIVLDFNLAYNPYCVYNPSYICAVPPLSNKLDVHIYAGEKKPSFLYH